MSLGASADAGGGPSDPAAGGLVVHFVGTATPRADVDRLGAIDRYPHTAANELQWCYLEAIRAARPAALHVTSAPAVSEYPRFPKLLVSAGALRLTRDEAIRFVPCVNVAGLKQLTQLVGFVALMWRRAFGARRARAVTLVYSLQTPFLAAAYVFRALLGTPVVLILPDLPEFMFGKGEGGIRAFLKGVDVRLRRRLLRRVDGAIVVARALGTDHLPAGTPCLVIDSIREVGEAPAPAALRCRRAILYSGGLSDAYGVGALLDAFRELDDPLLELWLAGRGDLEPRIREASAADQRVRLLGQLPLPELRRVQAEAALLVSVKPSREPFTRYSFPSKLTEYLAAGRPVASTVTPGIGPEYFEYVHALDDDGPEALRRSLESILRRDPAELEARARAGREFLVRTRSPAARGREVMAFLSEVVEHRGRARPVSPVPPSEC